MSLPAAKDWSAYSRDQFMKGTIHVERAAAGYSQLRNNFSTALIVLMCMVGLVLLIACANVANLLIARAVARQKEIAVRLSVGASRGQLVRQLLVESLVLSIIGAVCGVFLAIWITRALISLIPAEGNPLLLKPEPDLRILLFTLALTFVTSLIFGLVPVSESEPSRPVEHSEGRSRRDCGLGRLGRFAERVSFPSRWRSASCCYSAPVSLSAVFRI